MPGIGEVLAKIQFAIGSADRPGPGAGSRRDFAAPVRELVPGCIPRWAGNTAQKTLRPNATYDRARVAPGSGNGRQPLWVCSLGILAAMLAGCATPSSTASSVTWPPTPQSTFVAMPWSAPATALPDFALGNLAAVEGRVIAVGELFDAHAPLVNFVSRFASFGDDGRWTVGGPATEPLSGMAAAVDGTGTTYVAAGWDRCPMHDASQIGTFGDVADCRGMIWLGDGPSNWRAVTDPKLEGSVLSSVVAFDGGFVVAGARSGRATVLTSRDGRSWAEVVDSGAFTDAAILDLAVTTTGLVAVGQHIDEPVAWTSSDGASWWGPIRLPAAPDARVAAVAAWGDEIVAVGNAGGGMDQPQAWVTSDGREWGAYPLAGDVQRSLVFDVAGGPAGWLSVGMSTDANRPWLYGSFDGRTWSPLPIDGALSDVLAAPGSSLHRVIWAGDRFVIGAVRITDDSYGIDASIVTGLPAIAPPTTPATPLPDSTEPSALNSSSPAPPTRVGRLDGTLTLTGAVAGTFQIRGDCISAKPVGAAAGTGEVDGATASVQLDFFVDTLGLQIFREGTAKQDALVAAGSVTVSIDGISPRRGSFEAKLTTPTGPVQVEGAFECRQ